jgi:hypothetical protein
MSIEDDDKGAIFPHDPPFPFRLGSGAANNTATAETNGKTITNVFYERDCGLIATTFSGIVIVYDSMEFKV